MSSQLTPVQSVSAAAETANHKPILLVIQRRTAVLRCLLKRAFVKRARCDCVLETT